jgi:hypothetical protein
MLAGVKQGLQIEIGYINSGMLERISIQLPLKFQTYTIKWEEDIGAEYT